MKKKQPVGSRKKLPITSEHSRVAGPRYVLWEVSRACPLGCQDCRHSSLPPGAPGDLSTEQAVKLLDNVSAAYKTRIHFTGPEPLVRPDLFDLAEYARQRGLDVVLCTNAVAYDAKVARKLVEVRVKEVQISLDGASGRSHDSFRRTQNGFVQAIKGLDLVRLSGVRFSLSATLTKQNVEELPKMLNLSRKLGAQMLTLFFNVPAGRGRAIAGDPLDDATYMQWLNWIFEQQFLYRYPIQVVCSPQFERIYRERAGELPDELNPLRQGQENLLPKFGCLAAKEFCFIAADGTVYPCPYLLEPAGSALETSFAELWQQSGPFDSLRDTHHLGGKCGICKFADFCSGCRAVARATTGDYMAADPACEYQPV